QVESVVVPTSDVTNLFLDLVGTSQYQNAVLTGLGSINALAGTPFVSQSDVTAAYRLAQTMFDRFVAGGSNTGDPVADTNGAFNASQPAIGAWLKGFQQVAVVQNGDTDPSSWPGIFGTLKDSKGTNPQAYINAGSKIASTGLPVISFVSRELVEL